MNPLREYLNTGSTASFRYNSEIRELRSTLLKEFQEFQNIQIKNLQDLERRVWIECQDIRRIYKDQVHELQREIRGLQLQLQEQEVNQKKIQELQDYSERQFNSLQHEIDALHLQLQPSPNMPSTPFTQSSQGLQPPSRQPSSYKKPQPRTCERCFTEFPSGQALFRHLPDCQPFRCTKCSSTFQSNMILHKHIRGCRRTGLKEVFTGEN